MHVRVRNVNTTDGTVNNNNNMQEKEDMSPSSSSSSKSKKVMRKRSWVARETTEFLRAAGRLVKGQGSPISYLIIPAMISVTWLMVCILTTRSPSLTLEERLSQKHLRDYFDNQVYEESLLGEVRMEHHEHVTLPEGETINVVLAMPFLDINPLGATEYISTMEWILIYSTVPLTFHIITNEDSIPYVEQVFARVNASTETEFATEILTLNDIMDAVTDHICPSFKGSSEEFCDIIMGKMTPLLFPYLFPKMDHAVYVDRTMRFQDDIGLLYPILDQMRTQKSSNPGLAMAPEQTALYMKAFSSWQRMNPSTKLGRPPSEGKPGYNPDLILMDLDMLRSSATYKSFFNEYKLKQLIKNYLYLSESEIPSLGDVVNLMAASSENLFFALGCEWNRNARASSDFLEQHYNVCPNVHHVKAWNGNPNQERITQAKEVGVSVGKRRVDDNNELR